MDALLHRIRENGLDSKRYGLEELLGEGGYSLVFAHPDPALAVKATTCSVSTALLTQLMAEPRDDFVRVHGKHELGGLGPAAAVTAFLVERLDWPAKQAYQGFSEAVQSAAQFALAGATRPPKRGTAEYIAFNVRYCEGLAAADPARAAAWAFLASFVKGQTNPRLSVDVLTEGNLLARNGMLVLSDPVRQVWLP